MQAAVERFEGEIHALRKEMVGVFGDSLSDGEEVKGLGSEQDLRDIHEEVYNIMSEANHGSKVQSRRL